MGNIASPPPLPLPFFRGKQNFSQELKVEESSFLGDWGYERGVGSLRVLYFERRELNFLQLQHLHLVTETRDFAGFKGIKKLP